MAVLRAISKDKKIRLFFADITDAVNKISDIHGYGNNNKRLFADVAVATVVLSADIKEENSTFSAVLRAEEPFGTTVVVTNAENNIKGYSTAKELESYDFTKDIRYNSRLMIMYDPGLKTVYQTEVPVTEYTLDTCISDYLAQSLQHPGTVHIYTENRAAGLLIEPVLNNEMDAFEARKQELLELAEKLKNAYARDDIWDLIEGAGFYVTAEYDVTPNCDCNDEKIEEVIISIGKTEAESIIKDMGYIEVVCPYCQKKYRLTGEDVKAIFEEIKE